jgi:5-formyltetrahydrofolate cyclo-ligase
MDDQENAAAKVALRRTARAARRSVAARSPGAARLAAAHAFREIALRRKIGIISAYIPHAQEIDPIPLMHLLIGEGYRVCVPVIEQTARPLRFKGWRPGAPLVKGSHGILVPVEGEWLVPDLLIVPLLAFDPGCYRLGYGGGYYDRTIHDLKQTRHVGSLGLAYAAQEVAQIPTTAWDMPLDSIATEHGLIRPRQ